MMHGFTLYTIWLECPCEQQCEQGRGDQGQLCRCSGSPLDGRFQSLASLVGWLSLAAYPLRTISWGVSCVVCREDGVCTLCVYDCWDSVCMGGSLAICNRSVWSLPICHQSVSWRVVLERQLC